MVGARQRRILGHVDRNAVPESESPVFLRLARQQGALSGKLTDIAGSTISS
jgi:hypothetical protein